MPFHTASYWGKAHQMLLQGWPGSSTAVYVVAVLLVFFLAILAECLAHVNLVKSSSNRVAGCLFTAGMRAVRAGIASMAILAVMSYNAGIFIATIVGHAVGYGETYFPNKHVAFQSCGLILFAISIVELEE
ncbi:copper transporter 1-like [Amaranthus tricolor]|uniref:copper transporter 1-like n=1 Tax=Amaranthus tricolor TaxID=29722 RepID=UPI00258872ED|nr:copper transporter 1-like [Amaranthus tricolor]